MFLNKQTAGLESDGESESSMKKINSKANDWKINSEKEMHIPVWFALFWLKNFKYVNLCIDALHEVVTEWMEQTFILLMEESEEAGSGYLLLCSEFIKPKDRFM